MKNQGKGIGLRTNSRNHHGLLVLLQAPFQARLCLYTRQLVVGHPLFALRLLFFPSLTILLLAPSTFILLGLLPTFFLFLASFSLAPFFLAFRSSAFLLLYRRLLLCRLRCMPP